MPLGAFRINSLARNIADSGVSLDAVEFGSGVYYENTSMPDAAAANKQVTISVWMNIANTSPRSVAFGFRHTGGRLIAGPWAYNSGTAQTNATNRWYVQTSSHTLDRTSSENDLYEINEWHHFVYSVDFTVDDRNIAYVDGQQVTLTGFTASGITSNINWNDLREFWVHGYNNTNNLNTIRVAQIWIDDSYIDLSTNISKFYDNGPVDMGTDGTGSGLAQPLIYHYGDTSTFPTNNGSLSYSLSSVGGTPTDTTGPST